MIFKEDFKLCYVKDNFAYFTTQALDKQWGDDWDDRPYEHNAGEPYRPYKKGEKWEIKKISFEGNFYTPECHYFNSPYSIQDINSGRTPWLSHDTTKYNIYAGTSIKDFVKIITQSGGKIYINLEDL